MKHKTQFRFYIIKMKKNTEMNTENVDTFLIIHTLLRKRLLFKKYSSYVTN